ncbi:hypothetical protein BH11PLA1_BH11PLA1_07670 [soil metagenome]
MSAPTTDADQTNPPAVATPSKISTAPGLRLRRGWVLVTFAGMTLAIGGMVARVAQLQFRPPPELLAQITPRTSVLHEQARRGDVLDRRGRLLAATRFGFRVVLDPTHLNPKRLDTDLVALAAAIGAKPEEIGPRVLALLAENDRRTRAFNERRALAPNLTPDEQEAEAAGGIAGKLDGGDQSARLIEAASVASAERAGMAPQSAGAASAEGVRGSIDEPGDFSTKPETKPRLIRYVVLSDILDDGRVDAVRKLKVPGVSLESRAVREVTSPDVAAALVGKVGFDGDGLMAAEKLLDDRLQQRDGALKYIRDAHGRPLWIEPGAYSPGQRGQDVKISIDISMQRAFQAQVERGVEEADAQGGRGIIIDSWTGEVLAIADVIRRPSDVVEYDWQTVISKDKGLSGPRYITVSADPKRLIHPALAHNRVVEDLYEPGSTFKPFMWAAATDLRLTNPDEVIDTHWGVWRTPYGREVKDVTKRATMTWREVLINSSNIGMVQGTSRMTFPQMRSFVTAFGFGTRTNIGMPGESTGLVTSTKDWSKYTQTSVAFGHEVAVTPLQMARAFCAFARSGPDAGTIPPLSLIAVDGTDRAVMPGERVISGATAELTRETLRGVTQALDKKLELRDPPENSWRYELFGKSGTADIPMTNPPPGKRKPKGSDGYFRGQYNASFVAAGPVENPRLVCVVVIDDPGRALIAKKQHYGTYVAGPVVRRSLDEALAYLGVPASRTPTNNGPVHAE